MINKNDIALPASNSRLGLTTREYFAAMAMQGIIAAHSLVHNGDAAAELAVELADKLIEELNK